MTKFIQLGEKKNGRIVKNEQWSLDKFGELFGIDTSIKPSAFDKLFKTKKYLESVRQQSYQLGIKRVLTDMEILIDSDVKGKGSKKKTVKGKKYSMNAKHSKKE